MDNRVVKLQVKLFMDGDEEHCITMTSDIFKTQGIISSSLSVPNIDFWIRDAARALFDGRRPVSRSEPDPGLLQSIKIVTETSETPEIELDQVEKDSNTTEKTVAIDVQTSEQALDEDKSPQIDLVDERTTESEPLDISVTYLAVPDSQENKQLRVIVRGIALRKAEEHARQDTSRETGGVMLGMFIEDEQSITVVFTGIVRALSAVRESSTVKFTPETWAEIWQTIDQGQDYSNENIWSIVGWYHTHPDFGVFLSGYDKFIQKEYFTRKGHLALVIDPIRNEKDFFITDKEAGDTPALSEEFVTFINDDKDDKKLLQQLNKVQKKIRFEKLPPSEITLFGDSRRQDVKDAVKGTLKDKVSHMFLKQ